MSDERSAATEADEDLLAALRQERARAAGLERQLLAVHSSASFRLGHAIAIAIRAAAQRRSARAALRRLPGLIRGRRGGPEPAARRAGDAVLFLAWGLDAEGAERLAERLERLQGILVGFRAIVVVDSPSFEPLRRLAHPVEHVIPLADWTRVRPAHEWGAYLTGRMDEILAEQEPHAVVVLEPPAGAGALDQGALDTIILPGLRLTDDNLISVQGDQEPVSSLLAVVLEAGLDAPRSGHGPGVGGDQGGTLARPGQITGGDR